MEKVCGYSIQAGLPCREDLTIPGSVTLVDKNKEEHKTHVQEDGTLSDPSNVISEGRAAYACCGFCSGVLHSWISDFSGWEII